ncbi:MAG TPA: NAD(P)/FAD-dependent oxidoreductase [Candidatus Angelobacter sp.]|nr:NAD(P)/FAD-dependent oxidoreductase [Candidatus Angelobacter sp.]
MKRFRRSALIGVIAGAAASTPLILALGHSFSSMALGMLVGAGYAFSVRRTPQAYVDNLMTAGALGVPLWGLISVVALPLLSGQKPEWGAEQMRAHLPSLVSWVMFGTLLGIFNQGLGDLVEWIVGPQSEDLPRNSPEKSRIVILGGGFAGMKTAECLEQQLRTSGSAQIILVSETNALLFTPMLAEVAGSTLEPSHISTPLRSSLRRTEFIRGRVTAVDLENRRVHLAGQTSGSPSEQLEVAYDHLVLALGSVSNYLGMDNVQRLAFNFKSLLDAIRIRNHVIEMFERADRERDASLRAALLTFVVAGGGFAGVELAGALNDFARGILADYPTLSAGELNIVLVHSRDRILPELSESLARYAQEKMEDRGVTFRLNARLNDAQPGVVVLSDGEIRAHTLVWTAGTAPNPLVKELPFEKDKRGAVKVDSALAVPGQSGVWALGDCASVTDAKNGKACPPTAQFAIREAKIVARNIATCLQGRPATNFHFDSLGALCVIGHQTACAELSVPFLRTRSMRFSGLLAWLLWRGIYLAKLPGMERKIRVLMDWTVELFFPRDVVQTIDLQ